MKRIVILGAGGLAREVEWLLRDINAEAPTYRFIGYVVTDVAKLTNLDSKDQVLGAYDWLEANRGAWDCLALGIGTPASRLRVAGELDRRLDRPEWPTLVHPTAVFDMPSASLGRGVVICANVTGTVNLVLKDFAFVNLACTLGHEAVIGQGCVLNPTVNISGGVVLGDGALIGTGAQVLQYLTVGEGAQVGAGAVVTKDVAPNVTVVGVPAKALTRG